MKGVCVLKAANTVQDIKQAPQQCMESAGQHWHNLGLFYLQQDINTLKDKYLKSSRISGI